MSTIGRRIHDEFVEALQTERRITIEEMLERVSETERLKLARDLLAVEWAWRRSRGEHPSEANYSSRFPTLVEELSHLAAKDLASEAPMLLPLFDSASNYPQLDDTRAWESTASSSPSAPSAPGVRFGDYVLIGEIARGGMGVVYRARHVTLNRTVALKMILGGRLASTESVQRFYAEAQAAARLEHSGIVPIYEIGQEGDQHFFTMAFIDGDSLAQHVKSGPLPPCEAARLVKEIAIAVQYAHDRGIIHRDLKPQNILLDGNGHPKVTDFGLAKITDLDSGLSTTGNVMGTPGYMSPEQAAGRIHDVGPLADVYSTGAILYCLLTGRPPFQSASILETLRQVKEVEVVSPRVLNPAVPRDLDTITRKCLQKMPTKRYTSAKLLAEDLDRFLEGRAILARPTGWMERIWRWCRRNPLAAGLVGAGLTLILFAFVLLNYRNQLASADAGRRAAEDLANAQTYYALLNEVREAASTSRPGWTWTALDNLKVAAAVPTKVRADLDLRNLAARTLMQVDLRELHVLDPAEGALLKGIAFDPQGSRLAIGKLKGGFNLEVFVYDAKSLKRVQLLSQNTVADSLSKLMSMNKRYQDGVRSVAWSPDGKLLAMGTRHGVIHVWDTTANDPKPVSWKAHDGDVESMVFSADGRSLFSHHADFKHWNTADNWKQGPVPDGPIVHYAIHPQKRLWTINDHERLKVGSMDLGETHQVGSATQSAGRLAYSPDGRLLAVQSIRSVKILDARLGREVVTLRDETTNATLAESHLSFAAKGTLVVTLDGDRRLRLWDVLTGRLMLCIQAIAAEEPQVAVSDAANRIAVISGTKVVVYEARFSGPSQVIAVQSNEITAMDATADGNSVATITEGPLLNLQDTRVWQTTVWDTNTSRRKEIDAIVATVRPTPPGDELCSVAFGSNRDELFVSTPPFGLSSTLPSGTVKYASVPHVGMPVTIGLSDLNTEGTAELVMTDSAAAPRESLRLVVNERDPAVVRFDLTPDRVRSWPGDRWLILAQLRAGDQTLDHAVLETASSSGELNGSQTISGSVLPMGGRCQLTLGMITRSDVMSGKSCRVSLGIRSTVQAEATIWLDTCLAIPYRHLNGGHVDKHEAESLRIDFGGTALSGIINDRTQIATWEPSDLSLTGVYDHRKALTALTSGMSAIYSLDMGNSQTVAGLRSGNLLYVPRDKSTKSREVSLSGSNPIHAIALAHDEEHCAVGTLSGQVFWLDRHGRVLSTWQAHPESITAMALNDPGDRLVTAGSDRTIRVWERTDDHFHEFLTITTGARPPVALRLCDNGRRLMFLNQRERAVHLIDFTEASHILQQLGIRW